MLPILNYHYVSLSKVDMLFGQLPRRRVKPSGEIGVNLGLQGKFGLAGRDGELSVYQKLAEVVDRIDLLSPPGSLVDETSTYVRDRLDLSAVIVATDPAPGAKTDTHTVLFAGRSIYRTCVVLGGSAEHMGPKPSPAEGVTSSFYYLQHTVQRVSGEWKDLTNWPLGEEVRVPHEVEDGSYGPPEDDDESWHRSCIRYIAELAVQGDPRFQPFGYCEFLALRVPDVEPQSRQGDNSEAVLLTPLYVAQMEREEVPRSPNRW